MAVGAVVVSPAAAAPAAPVTPPAAVDRAGHGAPPVSAAAWSAGRTAGGSAVDAGWLASYDGNFGYLNGVVGTGLGSIMYSPYFGSRARTLFDATRNL